MSLVRRKAGTGSPFHTLTIKQLSWFYLELKPHKNVQGMWKAFTAWRSCLCVAWKVAQHRTLGQSDAGMSSGAAGGNVAWDSKRDTGWQVRGLD